ncbi:hypothetical protein ASC97_23465 [Rhizobium sp. Root1203]|nr:hypothetical protein ASC97_23465 [Rhizobium sp. Root1203]
MNAKGCVHLYDAYAPTIGAKHPNALGRPAKENWAELWDDLEPLLLKVREGGETIVAKDRPFYIERHGLPESVYFDISYSPVSDERGDMLAVFCIVNETTERVGYEATLKRLALVARQNDKCIIRRRNFHDFPTLRTGRISNVHTDEDVIFGQQHPSNRHWGG